MLINENNFLLLISPDYFNKFLTLNQKKLKLLTLIKSALFFYEKQKGKKWNQFFIMCCFF